jgi:hypothetical protein
VYRPFQHSISPAKILRLPFPLHISQLRTAAERAKSSTNGDTMTLPDIHRPVLPLLMEDDRSTNEVAPLFSKIETASIEIVLSELLEELTREQIRYIGVVSTDVKDSIFLASRIRRHCPNARVFFFLADML